MSAKKLTFSQRNGLAPIKEIQKNDMDEELRNAIWGFLYDFFNKYLINKNHDLYERIQDCIWIHYFSLPADENLTGMMGMFSNGHIKSHIMKCNWNEVYDLIEFIACYLNAEEQQELKLFSSCLNTVLEGEKSAYRLIDDEIVPITDEQEIKELEEALEQTKDRFKNVHKHLSTALHLMSDRNKPDYRNSIKESILAVEAISRLICDDKNLTLGKALNKIERDGKVNINGKLKSAYSQIYGYTNNEDGVRHALDEESSLDYEDAKYMLVSCTSFINYLIVKADKAGVFLIEVGGGADE